MEEAEVFDELVGGLLHLGGHLVPRVVVILKMDLLSKNQNILLNLLLKEHSTGLKIINKWVGLAAGAYVKKMDDLDNIIQHL